MARRPIPSRLTLKRLEQVMASSTVRYAVRSDKTIVFNNESGDVTISVRDGLLRAAVTWHPRVPLRLADDLAQLLDDWNRRATGLTAAGDRATFGDLIIVGAHSGHPVGAGIDNDQLRHIMTDEITLCMEFLAFMEQTFPDTRFESVKTPGQGPARELDASPRDEKNPSALFPEKLTRFSLETGDGPRPSPVTNVRLLRILAGTGWMVQPQAAREDGYITRTDAGVLVGFSLADGHLRVEVPWNSRVEKREVQPQSLRATLRAVTGWNVDSRLLTMIVEPDDDAPGDLQVKRPVRVVAYGIWCLAAGVSDRQFTELVVEAAEEAEKFIQYCRSSFMKEEEDDGAGA